MSCRVVYMGTNVSFSLKKNIPFIPPKKRSTTDVKGGCNIGQTLNNIPSELQATIRKFIVRLFIFTEAGGVGKPG